MFPTPFSFCFRLVSFLCTSTIKYVLFCSCAYSHLFFFLFLFHVLFKNYGTTRNKSWILFAHFDSFQISRLPPVSLLHFSSKPRSHRILDIHSFRRLVETGRLTPEDFVTKEIGKQPHTTTHFRNKHSVERYYRDQLQYKARLFSTNNQVIDMYATSTWYFIQ